MAPNYEQGTQTVKLTGPVKVVQVPVAPGRYVTGLLPVPPAPPAPKPVHPLLKMFKVAAAVVAIVLLLVGGMAGFLVLRSHLNQTGNSNVSTATPATTQSTPTTSSTAATPDNSILSDPLTINIRNLPEGTSATRSYVFKKDGYHITNLGKEGVAVVVQYTLPDEAMSYQLTLQEIKGDDTSPVNSFGMIFRYNQTAKGVSTFYSFEVVNTPGGNGKYWFYKYDSSKANPGRPCGARASAPNLTKGILLRASTPSRFLRMAAPSLSWSMARWSVNLSPIKAIQQATLVCSSISTAQKSPSQI